MSQGEIPCYILAGGTNRRMGQDKARVPMDGGPLLTRLVAQVGECGPVHVVAGSRDRYSDLGIDCLTDRPPGAGPLAGLCAAMYHRVKAYGDGWLVLVNCDLVKWSSQWLAELSENATDQVDAVAFGRTVTVPEGVTNTRTEERKAIPDPIPALYHTKLCTKIDQALARDHRSLMQLLASTSTAVIGESPISRWSFNTPEELAKLMKTLSSTPDLPREGRA